MLADSDLDEFAVLVMIPRTNEEMKLILDSWIKEGCGDGLGSDY